VASNFAVRAADGGRPWGRSACGIPGCRLLGRGRFLPRAVAPRRSGI